MKSEIKQIDTELDIYGEKNYLLDLEIGKLVAQQQAAANDMRAARDKLETEKNIINDIQEDLLLIADPMTADLKELRRNLLFIYSKYVDGKRVQHHGGRRGAERKRENLEKGMANLKQRMLEEAESYRRELLKLKREESELIASLNHLRKDEETLKLEIGDMRRRIRVLLN
jgi:hypothetical protein